MACQGRFATPAGVVRPLPHHVGVGGTRSTRVAPRATALPPGHTRPHQATPGHPAHRRTFRTQDARTASSCRQNARLNEEVNEEVNEEARKTVIALDRPTSAQAAHAVPGRHGPPGFSRGSSAVRRVRQGSSRPFQGRPGRSRGSRAPWKPRNAPGQPRRRHEG